MQIYEVNKRDQCAYDPDNVEISNAWSENTQAYIEQAWKELREIYNAEYALSQSPVSISSKRPDRGSEGSLDALLQQAARRRKRHQPVDNTQDELIAYKNSLRLPGDTGLVKAWLREGSRYLNLERMAKDYLAPL